jgi:hypothetical protein
MSLHTHAVSPFLYKLMLQVHSSHVHILLQHSPTAYSLNFFLQQLSCHPCLQAEEASTGRAAAQQEAADAKAQVCVCMRVYACVCAPGGLPRNKKQRMQRHRCVCMRLYACVCVCVCRVGCHATRSSRCKGTGVCMRVCVCVFLCVNDQRIVRSCVGLARTTYIRCVYGIFGRETTKYTVIYGVYI